MCYRARNTGCVLELIAALCPKRFASSGKFRPGPANLRFRYHHNPDDAGCGPALSTAHLLNPLEATYTADGDKLLVKPVLERIAQDIVTYAVQRGSSDDCTAIVTAISVEKEKKVAAPAQ